MAFRLKRGAALPREVRRLFNRQMAAAIARLEAATPAQDRDVIHQARKHVKKARATLRLVRNALGEAYAPANNGLRTANLMLGEVADARALVATLDHLRGFDLLKLPSAAADEIRLELLARANRITRQAEFSRMRERTIHLLKVEQARQAGLRLEVRGRSAVIPELQSSHRAARRARKAALEAPGAERFHIWRRRVKAEWYLLRLVADVCGGRLVDEQNQLEVLDECLGELHNLHLLFGVVRCQSPVSRRETAKVVLALRAYRRQLENKTRILSGFYDERSAVFAHRVRALWGAAPAAGPAGRASWSEVA